MGAKTIPGDIVSDLFDRPVRLRVDGIDFTRPDRVTTTDLDALLRRVAH